MNSYQKDFRNQTNSIMLSFKKTISNSIRIFTIIIISTSSIYSQNDDLNEYNPIIYDFTKGNFDKIFPFDQSFSIKIRNVEENINTVRLEIYEYDLRKTKFKLGDIIEPMELKDFRIVYISESWERSLHSGDFGEIFVPFRLKPSQNYSVKIYGEYRAKLTDNEKNDLTNKLKKDESIEDFINKISIEYLSKKGDLPNYEELDDFQSNFNLIAGKAVERVNTSFKVEPLELDQQLSDFANYVNGFSELKNNIEFFEGLIQKENLLDKSIKKKLESEIQEFKKQISEFNWGKTTFSDPNFINLKDFFGNKVIPKITLSPASSQAKSSIDQFFREFYDLRKKLSILIIENTIIPKTFKLSTSNPTYRTDFVKNAKLYINLDIGLSYVWSMDRIVTYSGVNIYFRPMNKNIPLSNYKGWDRFAVGSSFLLGITLNSVDKENVRKGIFSTSALVIGGGYRLNPFLKINTGTFIYYSNSNNPLISSDKLRTTFSPFISISIDLDVKPLFSGIGESIYK